MRRPSLLSGFFLVCPIYVFLCFTSRILVFGFSLFFSFSLRLPFCLGISVVLFGASLFYLQKSCIVSRPRLVRGSCSVFLYLSSPLWFLSCWSTLLSSLTIFIYVLLYSFQYPTSCVPWTPHHLNRKGRSTSARQSS